MKPIRLYAECYDEETDGTYLVPMDPEQIIAVARALQGEPVAEGR